METVEKIATDLRGNRLEIGDMVNFMEIGYRELTRGIVVDISNRTVTIVHRSTPLGKTRTVQYHNQVIKVDPQFGQGKVVLPLPYEKAQISS